MNDYPVEKVKKVEPDFKGKLEFKNEDLVVLITINEKMHKSENGKSEYKVNFKYIKKDGSSYGGGLGGNIVTVNHRIRQQLKGKTNESYIVDLTINKKIGFN